MQLLNNLTRYQRRLTKMDYHKRNGHGSALLWLTGLSGSGKSTLAHLVEERLFQQGWYTYTLDADHLRTGLNGDLGFSVAERTENIRRVGEVAKLFTDAGMVVLAAFISPFSADRDRVRALFEPHEFVEVYVKCPLSVCEARDPKGLYRKARAGLIPEFTGVDSPYEEPVNPELVVETGSLSIGQCVELIVSYLQNR